MKKFSVFLCTLTIVFGTVGFASANLIVNGDFETGDLSGWSSSDVSIKSIGGNHVAKFNDSPDWFGYASLKQGFYIPEGTPAVNIEFDYWFHEKITCDSYTDWFKSSFTFETEDFPWIDYNILTWDTNDTGKTHFSATYNLTGLTNWLWPDADNNAWIKFVLNEKSGSWWCGGDCTESVAYLDNVSAKPVPEPATMLLLGSGLLGLAGAGRKKFFKKKR